MKRTRFRRKDLKRPDEFVSRGRQVMRWAQAHSRRVTQVLVAISLATILLLLLVSVRSGRARQASEELAGALGPYRAGNYAQAATQLADVGTRWQSTAAGRAALMFAAAANLRSDNLESARLMIEKVAEEDDWPPYLRQQRLLILAVVAERGGDPAAAADLYARAAALEGPYGRTATLGEARCRAATGQHVEARAVYERYLQDYPDAPDREMIATRAGAP